MLTDEQVEKLGIAFLQDKSNPEQLENHKKIREWLESLPEEKKEEFFETDQSLEQLKQTINEGDRSLEEILGIDVATQSVQQPRISESNLWVQQDRVNQGLSRYHALHLAQVSTKEEEEAGDEVRVGAGEPGPG